MKIEIYQANPGYLWIDEKEIPLADAELIKTVSNGKDYIAIRIGTEYVLPQVGLRHVVDNNGDRYSSIDDFTNWWNSLARTNAALQESQTVSTTGAATADKQDDALGVRGFIVTGSSKTSMPTGYYAYRCTSWFTGSKIASCEKTVGITVSADTAESVVGVAMPVMAQFPFVNKVTSVTQTAGTDVILYWLKPIVQSSQTDLLLTFVGVPEDTIYSYDLIAKTIDVTVAAGTDITALIATLTTFTNVESVKIGVTAQESDVTENDFTNPVTYTLVAEDGVTTADWVVTVVVE